MEIDKEYLPKHIAIIMDGNRRWAKKRNIPIAEGHRQGAKALEKIVLDAQEIGIKHITVYAFSTENWKRSEEEVGSLMILLQNYLDDYSKRADTDNVQIRILGNIKELSNGMQKSIEKCIERTKNNTGIIFNIAFNYGGRTEIIRAVKEIANQIQEKKITIDDINEELITENLYTRGQPDPDLLVRTSGELRTSNFLPWQLVYTEFYFTDKYWPDFNKEDLIEAINEYKRRNRKFGAE